jgi:hypothetical protein
MHSAPRRAEQPNAPQHVVEPPRAKAAAFGNEAWSAIDHEPRWSHLELRRLLTERRLRWARDGGKPADWR